MRPKKYYIIIVECVVYLVVAYGSSIVGLVKSSSSRK